MKVKCVSIETDDSPDLALEVGGQYTVLSIEHGYYRIVAGFGGPCLYPMSLFDLVDAQVPEGWVLKIADPQEPDLCLGPPAFLQRGYWEDVHDRQEDALRTLVTEAPWLNLDTLWSQPGKNTGSS